MEMEEDMHCFSFVVVYGLVVIRFCTQQVINCFMLTKTCYIFSTLSNNFPSSVDFCVYPVFHWVSIGKNGTKKMPKMRECPGYISGCL